jgi:hypothetical protein
MGKTLDNFGFGLSIVFALLYWHSFEDTDLLNLNGFLGLSDISLHIVTTYTVVVFLTQAIVFGNLVFSDQGVITRNILRITGWSLILLGYICFLYLNGGVDLETLLNKRGGGINRFN